MSVYIKTIAIVILDNSFGEAIAIRSTLEALNFRTIWIQVGRPNDFIGVLSRSLLYKDIDTIVICTHGKESRFIMPVLGKDIYKEGEPKDDFGTTEIRKYGDLKKITVISTGCTLGRESMGIAFIDIGAEAYIAPEDYIDATSCLIFVQNYFYYISRSFNTLMAFSQASNIDTETQLFRLFIKTNITN